MPDGIRASTSVLFVRRRDAKVAKTHLENESLLDRQYRMTPVVVCDDNDGEHKVDVGNVDADLACNDEDEAVMLCLTSEYDTNAGETTETGSSGPFQSNRDAIMSDCIAVPVTTECILRLQQSIKCKSKSDTDTQNGDDDDDSPLLLLGGINSIIQVIVGYGKYTCPFSTAILGNNRVNRHRTAATATAPKRIKKRNAKSKCHGDEGASRCTTNSTACFDCNRVDGTSVPLTNVQHTLIETLTSWMSSYRKKDMENQDRNCSDRENATILIESLVLKLSNQTCPKKLEIIGDDRTLVVPRWSLFVDNWQSSSNITTSYDKAYDKETKPRGEKKGSGEFRELLAKVIHEYNKLNDRAEPDENNAQIPSKESNINDYSVIFKEIQSKLWENLAKLHNSTRVVRRGDIDPESGVRESGHRILWPSFIPADESITTREGKSSAGDRNLGYLPTGTGPNSPGWITVTEHKIRQSFDLTRVMFSRGNVTEKKRFGMSCVQPGEDVLDMYAGIGYYTLPALIHGKARHVTACEWNAHALYALRHNLKANGVDDRVRVLEGDCRLQLRSLMEKFNAKIIDEGSIDPTTIFKHQFDRISLGLLPSSEGGWVIAVSCLRQNTGGWLHVHGNVPTVEKNEWAHWICRSLSNIAAGRDGCDGWIAICSHVEKVKSFAPKVDHVVADVFLGPCNSPKAPNLSTHDGRKIILETGIICKSQEFMPTPPDTHPPSCALSDEGILHQDWLREASTLERAEDQCLDL